MAKSQPTEFDRRLGRRLRTARQLQGLTQAELASYLDISFQQLQKYEKGSNRISSHRLCQLAALLQQTPESLLAGLTPEENAHKSPCGSHRASLRYDTIPEDELQLIRAFKAISERSTRKLVYELVRRLA